MLWFNKPKFNKYGWKPQLPDYRDLVFKAPSLVVTPPMIDLRTACPPIKDQGELGSCTANGLTSCIEFLELKDKHPLKPLSRLFLYWNERNLEGSVSYDSGANIRDGIKSLNKQGCCLELLWPYNINRFRQKPNTNCYNNAVTHDIVQYSALTTLNDMKLCLASGFPFVLGFSVYESFESDVVTNTGIVPMPQLNESFLGGHCVYCVGYEDKTQMFTCANSWGTNWGMVGFFKIPYAYLSNRNMASDFWTIRKTKSE